MHSTYNLRKAARYVDNLVARVGTTGRPRDASDSAYLKTLFRIVDTTSNVGGAIAPISKVGNFLSKSLTVLSSPAADRANGAPTTRN